MGTGGEHPRPAPSRRLSKQVSEARLSELESMPLYGHGGRGYLPTGSSGRLMAAPSARPTKTTKPVFIRALLSPLYIVFTHANTHAIFKTD